MRHRVLYMRDDGTVLDQLDRVVEYLNTRKDGGTYENADLARRALAFALRDRRFLRALGVPLKLAEG